MSRRNLTVLLVALAVGALCAARAERNPYARYASDAYRLVDDHALEEPPDDELFAGAVRGMVAVLRRRGDEHTDYLGPATAEPFRDELRQHFGGVGVRVGLEGDPPAVVVVEPPQPGTPSYASPIRAGDRILSIDGEPTAALGLAEVVARMRGRPGSPVTVSVRHRDGAEESFRLVREVIRVPSIVGDRRTPDGGWLYKLPREPSVALVRVVTFGNLTVEELEAVLGRLQKEGVRRVVLDVRGNAGGPLDAAVGVCRLFLPAGAAIVSTRGRDGGVLESYETDEPGPFASGIDLAVLIDGDTASASEIVAAALQDHGRAVVVGGRSFGKGTVQHLLPLETGRSILKLTVASYWRPSGTNIHRSPATPDGADWGVSPEAGLEVSLTDDQRKAWSDWRRRRDLLATDGALESPDPLDADRALAAAVRRLVGERATASGPASAPR